MKNDFISIYIHFPFCIKKCMYCNFNSIPFSNDTFDSYISALHNEIKSFEPSLKQRKIQSIYLGGGTPSLAPAKTIKNLLEILPKNSIPSGGPLEVTMETNPGAIASDYFKNLLLAGVTRISFGVQSFNNTFLTEIGRIHDRKQAISAFEKARDAGFRNISIDLMFALPGQTLKEWEQDLYTAVSLQPDHISVYALTPEPGTLLHLQLDTKEKSLPEEETQRAMYIQALQVLKKNGYNHYEISNFSLPGKECIHNMNYWDNGEYAGFGAGAFSFLNTIRRENEPEIST
ncbi:MAG: radical SAM family heme chaperone HemW, partial [Nitrospinota bacterium]